MGKAAILAFLNAFTTLMTYILLQCILSSLGAFNIPILFLILISCLLTYYLDLSKLELGGVENKFYNFVIFAKLAAHWFLVYYLVIKSGVGADVKFYYYFAVIFICVAQMSNQFLKKAITDSNNIDKNPKISKLSKVLAKLTIGVGLTITSNIASFVCLAILIYKVFMFIKTPVNFWNLFIIVIVLQVVIGTIRNVVAKKFNEEIKYKK